MTCNQGIIKKDKRVAAGPIGGGGGDSDSGTGEFCTLVKRRGRMIKVPGGDKDPQAPTLRNEKGARARSHGACCGQRKRSVMVGSLRRLAAVASSSISFLQERRSGLALGWQGNARVSPSLSAGTVSLTTQVDCGVSGGTTSPTDRSQAL